MEESFLYIVPSWFTLNYRLDGHLKYLRNNGFQVGVENRRLRQRFHERD